MFAINFIWSFFDPFGDVRPKEAGTEMVGVWIVYRAGLGKGRGGGGTAPENPDPHGKQCLQLRKEEGYDV